MRTILSDAQILRESVSDPEAFAALYERHAGVVSRFAARRVGLAIAEDLSAEVFVRAFRARAGYRELHDNAVPWLLGIANNLVTDHRRAERRRLERLRELPGDPVLSVDPATGAIGLAPEVVGELLALRAGDRDALLLVAWGELSYAEAATALGVPIGTIRSRIARARVRLAQALVQSGAVVARIEREGGEARA